MRVLSWALVGLCSGALVGCGAKTGLTIPDASEPFDAGMDAGMDAGFDGGQDAGMCMPTLVELEPRGAQLMFVVDRSNSMDSTLDGEDRGPGDPRPSRWQVLARSLESVLLPADPLIEVGAKFYPAGMIEMNTAEEACRVEEGIDLRPVPGNERRFLDLFTSTEPEGGTPTAAALQNVATFFADNPAFVPRFVVLATDGGPNCNPVPPVPADRCVCTGAPPTCRDPMLPLEFRQANCLDAMRTFDVVRQLFEGLGVPVYVIGIDDPTRPDLADVLDEMAVLGGRPRDAMMGRRFYSVADTADLDNALTTITDSIRLCAFTPTPRPPADAALAVQIDGVSVLRDESRDEGWDYTRSDRSEMTFFGSACDRIADGGTITVEQTCPQE